ncbi:MAG: hypothetical protein ACRDPZ_04615, partial [Gaiellaceae bacterium]
LGVAPRRRRRRARIAALVGTALVVALGAGMSIGSLITADVTASEGSVRLGFVPEPGWFALQAATRSPADRPAVAMAANVPFAADDVVNGLPDPSSLPYSTLLTLPPRGIVIVASFIAAEGQLWSSTRYHARTLPLRIADATPYIEYGTQIRPDQPLGQYQLRVAVDGWNVDVTVYFGVPRPSAHLLSVAQRQLGGLLTRPAPKATRDRPARVNPATTPAAPIRIDRTFTCAPGLIGGRYTIEARVHRGTGRTGSSWPRPAFAAIGTSARGAAATAVENNVVWISGGRPTAGAAIAPGFGSYAFPFSTWGTVAVNLDLCHASSAESPLSANGLTPRTVGAFEAPLDCVTPRRVLVRVRATLRSASTLKSFRTFLGTTTPARIAEVAVGTPAGEPIAYAKVLESGQAKLSTAKGCVED